MSKAQFLPQDKFWKAFRDILPVYLVHASTDKQLRNWKYLCSPTEKQKREI